MMSVIDHTKTPSSTPVPKLAALDPEGGVSAGGVYDSVWTRDSFFALLGVDAASRPEAYAKLATRLWASRRKDGQNQVPFMFGSTVTGGKAPKYKDEKTGTDVVDANAICVLAASESGQEMLVKLVAPVLEWYSSRRRPDGLVLEGSAASWEDSLEAPAGPVGYTNALVYAAMVQVASLTRWSPNWPAREKLREALLDVVNAEPCAVSIGILLRWGQCDKSEFEQSILRLKRTGPYQKHRIACGSGCAPREPLWMMRLVGLGEYHTEARWPWTQLFLAGCLKDKEMGRPWLDLFNETGKLYETYSVSGTTPSKFWFLAPEPFSMNMGCLLFYIAETGR